MKKIAVVVTAALLSLTACTSDEPSNNPTPVPTETVTETPTPAPTETVTETATAEPEPEPQGSPEDILLEVVHEEYPQYEGVIPDNQIIDVAEATCDAFDAGATVQNVVDVLIKTADGDKELIEFQGFVVGAGTATLCPEYTDMVENSTWVVPPALLSDIC